MGHNGLLSFLVGTVGTSFVIAEFVNSSGYFVAASNSRAAQSTLEEEREEVEDDVGDEEGVEEKVGTRSTGVTSCIVRTALKDVVGSSMLTLMKVTTLSGVIASQKMQMDSTKGWVGIIILVLIFLFVITFHLLIVARIFRKKSEEFEEVRMGRNDDDFLGREDLLNLPKVESPFYEEGPRIDDEMIVPGSQLHRAMQGVEGGPAFRPERFEHLRFVDSLDVTTV